MESGDITTLNVSPSMAVAAFNTTGMSVKVGTSSTAGYKLSMSVANGGQLVSGTNSIPSLPENDDTENPYSCTVATGASCNFEVNSWGYRLGTDTANVYKPIPATETEILDYTAGATDENTTDFAFGVRANAKQPGGSYETTINFIATANPEGIFDIKNVQTMQDFAMLSADEYTAVVNSMEENKGYELSDVRDGTKYHVGKLADGRVWMLDNLALGGDSEIELTSATSNVTTSFTLPASSNTGFKSYDSAMINANYKDTVPNVKYGTEGSGKIGVYYNYAAASAGKITGSSNSSNGDPNQDICPAGWRLPTGGSSGEFRTLCNAVKGSSCSEGDMNANALKLRDALNTPLSGYFYDSSAGNQGTNGYGSFWASTRNSNTNMYRLDVGGWLVYPQGGGGRDFGSSVRCVLKPFSYGNMQNISTETLTNILPEDGDTAPLTDNRDGTVYAIGKLNGKYWMLDSLALGGSSAMILTGEDTNLATASTKYILPASGTQCFTDQNTTCTGAAGSNNTTTDATKTGNGYTVAAINADFKTTTQDGNGTKFTYNSNGDVSKAGVYYNYCAASAGTICDALGSNNNNAQYDICPKGWRLPTGGGSGEFQALTNNLVGETSTFDDAAKYVTFKAAFHAGLSGSFYNGSVQKQASRVNFWSSTRSNGNSMYNLLLDTTTVYPQGSGYRYIGDSVRCVYGG